MPVPLRPYAETPVRLALQLAADLLALAWTAVWIRAAVLVHGGLRALASAGYDLRDGAGGVGGNLTRAGDTVHRTPLIGGALAEPLGAAGSAAGHVAAAGRTFGDRLSGGALPVAIAVAVLGALPVVLPWLVARWHYARRAGATSALARDPGGRRLLALRALTGRPAARLLAVDPDPVGAWDRGDERVTAALAALELRAAGLRPARTAVSSP